jgi:hypothetical protein
MWRSACAAGLGVVLMSAAPASAGGPPSGTWKGTLNLIDSKPVNVELRITQQETQFKGTGVGCDQSPIPGCPPGTGNGNASFRGGFLNPVQAGALSIQFDVPQVTSALTGAASSQAATCVYFVSAIGSLSSDGHSLNFLMRGQDSSCNPILGLLTATNE